MNRSLRLLRPTIGRSIAPLAGSARSSLLIPRSPISPIAGPSKIPTLYAPQVLGVRLYVSPTATVRKDEKKPPKEVGVVGSALAEAKDVVADLKSIISGGQAAPAPTAFSGMGGAITPGNNAGGVMAAMENSSHSHGGNVAEDFAAVTTGLLQTVPKHVMLFGLAGTIPYLSTAVGTVFLAREANLLGNGHASLLNMNYDTVLDALHHLESAQITYGAVILSFLGALHWGMEFVGFGGEQGYRRLAVGTLPLVFAFPTLFMSHGVALASQWVGFTLTWFMDQRATQNGWTPSWFATYRFYLSIIVGFSIIGTLAGTSYYQEGAGSDFAGGAGSQGPDSLTATPMKRFSSNKAKEKERRQSGNAKGGGQSGPIRGTVGGDIYIEEDEALEAYGRLKNRTKAAEDEEDEEEEEESAEDGEDKEEGEEKEEKEDNEQKDENEGGPSEDDEGGSAGKSQAKQDNPSAKGEAGAKNTGLR